LVTASLWLSSVNFMLAVFNLIPGFPLDGGRLFRALVWWLTGDHLLATRLASTGGRWFGWGLMALGLWRVFGGGDVGGLWFVLIGWFLSHLATSSYTQTVAQRTLRSLKIGDLMRTRFEIVPASLNVEDFVENYLLRSNQLLWPVTDGQQVLGLVAIANVADIPLIERSQRSVGEVMSLLSNMPVIDAGALATQALGPLFAAGDAPVGVVRDGQFVGLVRGSDVLRWITLHRDLAKHSSEDLRA
jgi:predicted transcriptional regulator